MSGRPSPDRRYFSDHHIVDKAIPDLFGGYITDRKVTHSLGIKPGIGPIREQLKEHLTNEQVRQAKDEFWAQQDDDRPLIDKLQEATFGNSTNMQWIKDKYAFRSLLRKAHCFVLDAETSALVADFSLAIISQLDDARQIAIPPFPVTWFDLDNVARLARITERGLPLTMTAAGETSAGPPVTRVGWLIHPSEYGAGGYHATYCTEFGGGPFVAPMSYYWHVGAPVADPNPDSGLDKFVERLTFGIEGSGVIGPNARVEPASYHLNYNSSRAYDKQLKDLMLEIGGELRFIWGLLIALACSDGVTSSSSLKPKPSSPPKMMKNGKPLLPIEHKDLYLHLNKRQTVQKVVIRAITHHRKKEHEVRFHMRKLRNPDGSIRKHVKVREHKRGDPRLGRVVHPQTHIEK